MTPEQTPPKCPNCGSPMDLKEKGGDRFWGCPNYRDCKAKTVPYTKASDIKRFNKPQGTNFQKVESRDNPIIDEIQTGFREVNERLDKLIEHVVTKL